MNYGGLVFESLINNINDNSVMDIHKLHVPAVYVVAIVSFCFSVYFGLESRYAAKTEAATFYQHSTITDQIQDSRIELYQTQDDVREYEQRQWLLEDRVSSNPDDITAAETLREVQSRKQQAMEAEQYYKEQIDKLSEEQRKVGNK